MKRSKWSSEQLAKDFAKGHDYRKHLRYGPFYVAAIVIAWAVGIIVLLP